MKAKYIIASLVAACALAIGCTKETPTLLDEIQVDSSYIGLSNSEGTNSKTITVTAKDSWSINSIPEWLTINPQSGSAGETKVTFSAEKATATRENTIKITCAGKEQLVIIKQEAEKVEPKTLTVAEAIEICSALGDKEVAQGDYRVKGIVCNLVDLSVQYGNVTFWISDNGKFETGNSFEVYRALWLEGAAFKAGDNLDIGDEVIIEGKIMKYGSTPETKEKEAYVYKINKSLIKCDSLVFNGVKLEALPIEGGEFEAALVCKGDGVSVTIPDDAKSWLSVTGIQTSGDKATVTFLAAANEGGDRSAELTFVTTDGSKDYTAVASVTQVSGLDCYPLPYEEKFESGIGAWTISDVKGLESGNVWFHDSQYKYMKASGYVGGVNNETESDLISPRIDLTSATVASLSFDHAAKYGASLDDEFTLWVSKDNGESWSQILIPVYTDKQSWNFVTNTVSLNPFVGNQVLVKFKYKSYTTGGSTLEIKNVKIVAENVAVTNIAQLQGLAINKDTKSDFTATLSDALVTYVNGNNVFIQDTTGGVLLYKSNHGFVAGDKINGTISGQITIYGGFAEVTDINVSSATVSHGETITPKVLTVDDLIKTFPRHMSCQIKLEGVTLDKDLGSNRNATLKQGDSEIAAYAKVKDVVTIEANKEGDLICYPCINNTPDKIQVGIWEAGHFTAK